MDKKSDLEHLSQMFPSIEAEVIDAVYEANGCSLELSVNDLVEISGGSGSSSSNQPRFEAEQAQVMADEEFARSLQARESKKQQSFLEARRVREALGTDEDQDDEFKKIGEVFKKGVESVKSVFRRVSEKLNSNAETTPRTEYAHIPKDDFEFLHDEDGPISPTKN